MDFSALDHKVRVYALVGYFLHTWALLEASINDAIGKVLGLDSLQTVIVSRNAQITAKIHILRTALTLTPITDRERFNETLNGIQNYTHVRNMMAHDIFFRSKKSDGVKFIAIKAKGSLKFPEEDWSVQKFKEETDKLYKWAETIDDITAELTPPKDRSGLINSILSSPLPSEPKEALFGLADLGRQYPHSQDTPDSTPLQSMLGTACGSPPSEEK